MSPRLTRLGCLRPAELRRVRSEIATGPRNLERASRERDLEMAHQRLMLSPTHRQVELPQEGRQGCQKRIEAVFCWTKSSAGRAKVKLRGRERWTPPSLGARGIQPNPSTQLLAPT